MNFLTASHIAYEIDEMLENLGMRVTDDTHLAIANIIWSRRNQYFDDRSQTWKDLPEVDTVST